MQSGRAIEKCGDVGAVVVGSGCRDHLAVHQELNFLDGRPGIQVRGPTAQVSASVGAEYTLVEAAGGIMNEIEFFEISVQFLGQDVDILEADQAPRYAVEVRLPLP